MKKLFLDDVRSAPDESWTVVRTADEAIALLRTGTVDIASLDHDLGGIPAMNGGVYDFTVRDGTSLARQMAEEGIFPNVSITVHSINHAGATRMVGILIDACTLPIVWKPDFRTP